MIERVLAVLAANWGALAALVLIVALTWSAAARSAFAVALRLASRPLLLAAVIALVYDGTRTLAGNSGLITTSLADHWQSLAPASFEATRLTISQRMHPWLWDSALLPLLRLPAWLVLGCLGLALSYIGRRRQGVNVFAN
jgi:hypothetical protein